MIFRPELAQAILDGSKTETRRKARFRQVEEGTLAERSEWIEPPYKPGKTYAIQPGRGKRGIGRIRVHSVTLQLLYEMTDEDIRAEGFQNQPDFQRTWLEIHGNANWLDPVSVIRFELVPDTEED